MVKSGPRMLKGLSLDNLIEEDPEESIEQDGEDRATDEKPPVGRRSLRQRNHDAIYDMKYHPMDVVTRPNRAATIRHRSKSVSFAYDDDDDDKSSGASSTSSGGRSEDEGSDEAETVDTARHPMILTPRTLDPRAVRHSARSEARKPINYSKKHHPQDYGLPGFKHRAAFAHPQVHIHSSSPHKNSKKRKHMLPTPEDDGQVDLLSAYDNGYEEEEEEQEHRRPRKKLRSLNPNIVSSSRPANTPAKRSKSKAMELPDSDDIDKLIEMALSATQQPSRQTQASPDAKTENADLKAKQTSQQSPQMISSQSDELSSKLAGDENEKEEEEVPESQEPESDTSITEEQVTGPQSFGSLSGKKHVEDGQDGLDEEDKQVKHDAISDDQPDGHSGSSKQLGDIDEQPQHDTTMGDQPTGDVDSSQKLSDTKDSDQQVQHDSPMSDQHGDGSDSSPRPDDVDETDQQQDHDCVDGNKQSGHSDSTQQQDDDLKDSRNPQSQSTPKDDFVSGHNLGAELLPGSLPPQSHQPGRDPMADRGDGPESNPEGDEESRQHSEFEEQFDITAPGYKDPDSEGSLESYLGSDPTHLVL